MELATRALAGLRCDVSDVVAFDRKSYLYPDLPKGFQITQKRQPLGVGGSVSFEVDGREAEARLAGAHLEEDSAKTQYVGDDGFELDFNRAGVALLEVVTLPELDSGAAAAACGREIQRILRASGASEARFEDGSMRIDVNISVRPQHEAELRPKIEIKNLNSLKAVRQACDYEATRQADAYEAGHEVVPETRNWDGAATRRSRDKGGAEAYRYAPEPDLPSRPCDVDAAELRRHIEPLIPSVVRARLRDDYGLTIAAAAGLVDADDRGTVVSGE